MAINWDNAWKQNTGESRPAQRSATREGGAAVTGAIDWDAARAHLEAEQKQERIQKVKSASERRKEAEAAQQEQKRQKIVAGRQANKQKTLPLLLEGHTPEAAAAAVQHPSGGPLRLSDEEKRALGMTNENGFVYGGVQPETLGMSQEAFAALVGAKKQEPQPEKKEAEEPVGFFRRNANSTNYTGGMFAAGMMSQPASILAGAKTALGDAVTGGRVSDGMQALEAYFAQNPDMLRRWMAGEQGAAYLIAQETGVDDAALDAFKTAYFNDWTRGAVEEGFGAGLSDKFKDTVGDWAYTIGAQVPGMVYSGMAAPGAGAGDGSGILGAVLDAAKTGSGKVNAAGNAAIDALKGNVATWLIGAGSTGSRITELARERGYDPRHYLTALGNGFAEYFTEGLFGISDAASVQRIWSNADGTAKKVAEGIGKWLMSGAEEGLEEFVNVPMSRLADSISDKSIRLVGKGGVFDAAEMVRSGLDGAIVGLIMGSVGAITVIDSSLGEARSAKAGAEQLNRVMEHIPEGVRPEPMDPVKATREAVQSKEAEILRALKAVEDEAIASDARRYGVRAEDLSALLWRNDEFKKLAADYARGEAGGNMVQSQRFNEIIERDPALRAYFDQATTWHSRNGQQEAQNDGRLTLPAPGDETQGNAERGAARNVVPDADTLLEQNADYQSLQAAAMRGEIVQEEDYLQQLARIIRSDPALEQAFIAENGEDYLRGMETDAAVQPQNDGRLALPAPGNETQGNAERGTARSTAPDAGTQTALEPLAVQQARNILDEFEGTVQLTEAQQRMVEAARQTVREWEKETGVTERMENTHGAEQETGAAAGADSAVFGQKREPAAHDPLADQAVEGRGQPGAAAESQSKIAAGRTLKAEQLRLRPVSTKSLGIEGGSNRARVTVYPREAWDEELTQAAKALEDRGYEVQFVLGAMEFAKPAMLTDGCVVGDKVIVRANSMRHTATELCEHERFHTLMNENPGASAMIWEKVDAELWDSRYDRLVEQYVQTYLEAYEGDEARIREELMADAYAGLNRFGEMPKVQQLVRELTQQVESGEAAELLPGQVEPGVRSSQTAREQNRTRDGTNDLGDENTVFADGGESYSIGEIVGEDQKNYGIGVHLDSTLLENLTPKERIEMVKERVKELGGEAFTAYDGAGNAVDISIAKPEERFKNRNGKTKPVIKDLTTKYSGNETKQESVVLLNELIETANFDASKEPTYPHDWLDNNGKNEWDYWTTYVQGKNGTIWKATLNVANAADGRKILYDIGPIKKVGQSVKSDTSLLSAGQRGNSRTSTAESSVAEKLPSVKGQYSITPETKADNHPLKEAQLRVIQQSNPADDTYHTWIRDVEDIHTLDEVLEDPEWDYDEFDPDYTRAMAEDAIQTGEIRVYSSYPISEGVFVTPSEMEAESYSADGRVYSEVVPIEDVAWIDPTQGQYAPVSVNGQTVDRTSYSLTQATEGRKMSSRARQDVNQTMNAVQTELRGLIEAETRAARDTQNQVLAELAQSVLPDGTAFRFSEEGKSNAAQELSRGVTVSGSLADTTSAASENSIPKDGKRVKYSAFNEEVARQLAGEDRGKVKFSAEDTTDSAGRELTAQQREYFKDSENPTDDPDIRYSLTQATEGRKMSSRARRDVNQTMNAVQTELRGLIEAETRAAH